MNADTDSNSEITATLTASLINDPAEVACFLAEWCSFVDGDVHGLKLENDPRYLVSDQQAKGLWLMIVRQQDRVVAVAAMYHATVSFTIRFSVFTVFKRKVRELRIAGSAIVLANDCDHKAVLEQMFITLHQQRRKFDWLNFEGIDEADSALATLRQVASQQGWHTCSRSAHPEPAYERTMPPDFNAFMASLGKSTRKRLRRQVRPWVDAEENATSDFIRCSTRDSIDTFLVGVDSIYQDSWQGKTYGFYPRNTQAEHDRLARLVKLGWWRSYLLMYKEEPVAFVYGYQHRGVFYDAKIAYAQRHEKLGAGSALYYLILKDLYGENTPDTFDMGQGKSGQKIFLRGIESMRLPVYFTNSRPLAVLVLIQRELDRLESCIRAFLIQTGFDRRVRRILKGGGILSARKTPASANADSPSSALSGSTAKHIATDR